MDDQEFVANSYYSLFSIFISFFEQIISKKINKLKGNENKEKSVHTCFFLYVHAELGA